MVSGSLFEVRLFPRCAELCAGSVRVVQSVLSQTTKAESRMTNEERERWNKLRETAREIVAELSRFAECARRISGHAGRAVGPVKPNRKPSMRESITIQRQCSDAHRAAN
jgi:hypothetical protein